MSEQNIAVYKRFIDEVFGQKKLDVLDELISPDFVDHNPLPGTSEGRDGMKEAIGMFLSAFPDAKSTLTFTVAEGDIVVGHQKSSGTNTGEFMGMPPTGKSAQFDEIHIVRFSNGKAVEHWGLSDDLGMMMQLGVVPEPGQG
ncbi:MAG: ester cyclase [Chloroflexi bacterium]|nr:ester cyclase [Chloroflexota bacterium]